MLVTRIVRSKGLNASKLDALVSIAKSLGRLRAEAWRRYGSVAGVGRSYYDIRNEWMASGRKFNVPARLWKETLNDVLSDIKAYREAAKKSIHRSIFARTESADERKRLFTLLKSDKWLSDAYLRRMMRKQFKHGHTTVDTHIKLDKQCYNWFEQGGRGWVAVMSMERGKRIAIPLASNRPVSGTIRLIVKPGVAEVEIHHTVEVIGKPCGVRTIGIDKGYTEAFVDSDGDCHGLGLGAVLSAQTDRNNVKYQRRNKIKAIAEKSGQAKRDRILKDNLGRTKLDNQKAKHGQRVKTIVYTAANTIADKAKVIVAEDLTAVIREHGKTRGKQTNRRLSGWVKGMMAGALEDVSHRRGSTVSLVNCAYSSQVHSSCGCLGVRDGDVLHCELCKVDAPSDHEAARVILARLDDREIGRWTPYQKVKSILLERARYRLRLSSQGSSCAAVASTERELPISATSNCG
jgi:IS605 OrfB family transposase